MTGYTVQNMALYVLEITTFLIMDSWQKMPPNTFFYMFNSRNNHIKLFVHILYCAHKQNVDHSANFAQERDNA